MLKSLLIWLLRALYKVTVHGEEHLATVRQADERILVVANHQSFLDALLLYAFMPRTPMFAVDSTIAKRWWMKPVVALISTFPMDPTNPMAAKGMIDQLKQGKMAAIFPEGRITVTGSLMKIYEGPAMIADKAGATILPVRIDGAQYTPFSRLRGKVRLRWFPTITVTILPPCTIDAPDELRGRTRRSCLGKQLYHVMTEMLYRGANIDQTLASSLVDAMHVHGRKHVIIEDIQRAPVHYGGLLTRIIVLARLLARQKIQGDYVGLMLPNVMATLVALFAMHAIGRVPAMLNYTSGRQQLEACCKAAEIRTVITLRQFVTQAKLEAQIEALEQLGVKVLYLDEMRDQVSLLDKAIGLLGSFAPLTAMRRMGLQDDASRPAVILFTSGSEGLPKGVVLSHRNLQANRTQLAARVDFSGQDVVFNALPLFHSFGLMAATLLPLLYGVRCFLYPSPLHYRIVPELVYHTNATLLFGTDTFLSGYAKFAHPYDFYAVRYVFAGAEKLREETRRQWAEQFGLRIFEGYGATETSPVLAANSPMAHKAGTVGRFLPGIETELKPVEGIDEGGCLWVRGDNIMLGYVKAERPGVIQPPEGGWYDTGDIVTIDEDGFVTIAGRAKRFAKIGGEMVSLTAVEAALNQLWPEADHAVVALSDKKKGEKLVLATTENEITRELLARSFKKQGLPELYLPRDIIPMDTLPVLGTGKVDYVTLKKQLDDAEE